MLLLPENERNIRKKSRVLPTVVKVICCMGKKKCDLTDFERGYDWESWESSVMTSILHAFMTSC